MKETTVRLAVTSRHTNKNTKNKQTDITTIVLQMKFVPIQLILVAISTGLTFAFKWDSPDSADINVVGAVWM